MRYSFGILMFSREIKYAKIHVKRIKDLSWERDCLLQENTNKHKSRYQKLKIEQSYNEILI